MDNKQDAIDGILSGRSFRMGDWETVKAIVSEAYDAGKRDADAPEEPLAYWEVKLLEGTEPQDTLWGFKVGDRVRYTDGSAAFLGEHEVIGVYPNGGGKDGSWPDMPMIALADPQDSNLEHVGSAYAANEIEHVPAPAPQVGDTVRVVVGATGEEGGEHLYCEGLDGILEKPFGSPGIYSVPGHRGPLSDFEKVDA